MAELLGYWPRAARWSRRGRKPTRLHLAKFTLEGERVQIESACRATVEPWPEGLDPKALTMAQPTAAAVLPMLDQYQRAHLCPSCWGRVTHHAQG